MAHDEHGASAQVVNLGWLVTAAGVGINLALGILYCWSVIAASVPKDWGWSDTAGSWPYAIACLVFSLSMVPAGRLQDRFGPRLTATIGGVLVGAGMIVSSFTTSTLGYTLGFGLLAGAGIGFAYAAATPAAVKWFPPSLTGLIAGLVVSGFGLAAVYAGPLAKWLIGAYSLPTAMLTLGVGFLVMVVLLAQLLFVPPKGYRPDGTAAKSASAAKATLDASPSALLGTLQFYLVWILYFCGAGAGLMVIGKLTKLVDVHAGIKEGVIVLAALAVGNGAGRIIAGMLSDCIGRLPTLRICFVLQIAMLLALTRVVAGSMLAALAPICVIAAVIGANYGANLAVFPAMTKDYFGLKHFGVNYGLIFTAWGAGSFVLSPISGRLFDLYHGYHQACYLAAGLLALAVVVSFFVRRPQPRKLEAAAQSEAAPDRAGEPALAESSS